MIKLQGNLGFFLLRGLNSDTYFFPWSARLLVSSQHIFIYLFSRCNKCYIKCKTELANCLCCLYGFPEWADIKCFLKMLFLCNLLKLSDIHALVFLQLWRKMKFPLSIDKVWVQEYNGGIRIDDKVPKLQCLDCWLLFEDLIFLNKFNTKN